MTGLSIRFLITLVISSTVELKYNEWMTVVTVCDTDLIVMELSSLSLLLPLKLKILKTDRSEKPGTQRLT